MNGCIRSARQRLSALETYGFLLAGLTAPVMLEDWRNQSPATRTEFFRCITEALVSQLDLNRLLQVLFPRERRFETKLEERSEGEPHCFKDTYNHVLATREALLSWLLMATYDRYPPTAVEAYRFLKLGDIQKLLETIAFTLESNAEYVTRRSSYELTRYIEEDHNKQIEFLFQTLEQYGIEADTYSEAAKGYIDLLDSIFPASSRAAAPAGAVTALVSLISDTAGH